MASSSAESVEEYLEELPPERRAVVAAVRDVVRDNLPEGFEETMDWGMISYQVPLERYPDTYNGKPLMYAALAARKNYYSLHLMCVYMQGGAMDPDRLREAFRQRGKKLDMGKSCVRFRQLDDLPLDVVVRVVSGTTVQEFIDQYEASRR